MSDLERRCLVCGKPTSVSVGDGADGVPCCVAHQDAAVRYAAPLLAAYRLADKLDGDRMCGPGAALRDLIRAVATRLVAPPRALSTLAEFNAARREAYARDRGGPRPSGIACPACGSELVDSDPSMTLMSNPPQKNVACPACGFTGYRLA